MSWTKTSGLLVVLGVLAIAGAVGLVLGKDDGAAAWLALIGAFMLARGIGDSITGATPDQAVQRRHRFHLFGAAVAGVVGLLGGVLLLFGVYGPDDGTRFAAGGFMVIVATAAIVGLLKEVRSASDPE